MAGRRQITLLSFRITTEIKTNLQGDPEEIKIFTGDGKPLDMNRIYTVAMYSYMTQVYKYDHADPGQSLFFYNCRSTDQVP
jgi:hypothetical protein